MKTLKKIIHILFRDEHPFKVRLFNVLALCGSIISLITTASGLFTGATLLNSAINFGAFLLSATLLVYTAITGKYKTSYFITIIALFLVMFPLMFFTAGGYNSGMPGFFVFAVVFTVFMLDGAAGIILGGAELVIYAICCITALNHPETVTPFPTESDVVTDIIVGFTASSIALGATMLIQFSIYTKQQRKTEEALEEAELQSRAKGIFLANMSHEIRTPINVILATSEMINRTSTDDRINELNKSIGTSGEYLLSIISNVLDITKIESGRIDIDNTAYSLSDFVSDQELIGQELATKKGLSFRVNRNFDKDTVLFGDCNHIRQISTNLISNAVKYTPKGMVSVTFSVEKAEKDRCVLRFSVTDTGIGIKAEDIGSIFDSFKRADFATKNSIEGTGLGLAIVKQLANAMNGEITVTSDPGKGSCFTAEIPQMISEAKEISSRNIEFREYIAPKSRILAVDDNEENLHVLKLLLEKLMISIDTATSGQKGLELARKNNYDVIILDYMMPVMDGIQTLEAMKNAGVHSEFIVLTADAIAGTEKKMINAGFSAYITKPVKYKELEQQLLRLLPQDKISYVTEKAEIIADASSIADMEKITEGLDMDIQSGLKLVYSNLEKYGKICGIFYSSCSSSRTETDRFFEVNDYDNLIYSVHSLKSRAMSIGAVQLSRMAKLMEEKTRESDREYLITSYPLLCLEWDRAKLASKLISDYCSKRCRNIPAAASSDTETMLEELKNALDQNIWLDSSELLKTLCSTDSSNKEIYTKALEHVENLEFTKALELISAQRG